jgi:hypothetical protein
MNVPFEISSFISSAVPIIGTWRTEKQIIDLVYCTLLLLEMIDRNKLTVSNYWVISWLIWQILVENTRQDWLGQEQTSVLTVSNYWVISLLTRHSLVEHIRHCQSNGQFQVWELNIWQFIVIIEIKYFLNLSANLYTINTF